MTLDEFKALAPGDKITSMHGDIGEIVDVGTTRHGVKTVSVEWAPGTRAFDFTSNQLAWVHWSKVETEHAE